jgi:prolyl-tRNA synthetase
MEKMTEYFNAPNWQMLKTVVYKTDSWKYFSIIIRGDLDVNEIKVRKFVAKKYGEWFTQATEEDLIKLWTIRGFVTPIKDSKLKMDNYADHSLLTVKNFFGWANALAKSTKNVNIVDLDILEYSDFNEPKEGFTSNNLTWEKLTFRKACEVGNIFYLWDKYSKPFWLSFSDENNKTIDRVEMWCYWIWISRLMWVLAEYFMTENWIAWPENITPYDYYIIVIWAENISKWEELAKKLEKEWKSIILDDRLDSGFGQRAWDCELWWIPNRIVVSEKTVKQGGYELQKRWEEAKIMKF